MKRYTLILILGFLGTSAFAGQDNPLYGVWKPVTYIIQGVEYPLTGLMIITPGYMSANTVFKFSEDSPGDANANAGPYVLEGNKMVLNQWMQLHWRPLHQHNPKEHFLAQNIPEEIPFEVKGDQLIFSFPSGNKYISERIKE